MIISDEQVQLALEYLHASHVASRTCVAERAGCTPDLVERVRHEIACAPEVRGDRLDDARRALDGGGFTPVDIADKMIGRAISDSLR